MSQEINAPESIKNRLIEEEMKQSYLDYSMSVIVGRALPDARDGLKPVQRRILFAMNDMGMFHNKPYKKCARIVGETLGKYHPHGDTAVYDALVRMAQNFSLRYTLIQGQGNFGSVDGDSAAAMRYCVVGDSLVVTENGLQRINQISEKENINLKILSKDKRINNASKWFDSGEHKTLKITTHKGYSLTGTLNHPILILSSDYTGKPVFIWKLFNELKEGDYAIIDRSTDNFWPESNVNLAGHYPNTKKSTKVRILPTECNDKLAFILGAFVSEGSLTKEKIEFCNTDFAWIEELKKTWEEVFPDSRLHLFKRKPSSFGKKEYYRLECHCRHTISFLENIGLRLVKSGERSLPNIIFNSPKGVAADFLRAYFEGDGSISFSKKMIELSCISKSEKLVEDVQVLLLRFGIDSFKRFDKYRGTWKLYLRGQRNVLRFYKEIGFNSDYKKKKLEYVVFNYKKESSMKDYVPFISDYIRSRTDSEFVNKNNFDRYSSMERNSAKVSSILLEESGFDCSSMFEYFLTYNYLFDEIVQIQDAGTQRVFSIKVESNCHSFISNGFISHNTEARLNKIAEEMLADIEKNTVKFVPNFDESLEEPSILPGKVPNLLVNGSSGIAVGMATNIPPHNLTEVADGIIAFIDNPEVKLPELMTHIKGPDFPTGGIITGIRGIEEAYFRGYGKIKIKSRTEIEKHKEKERIIITEIPYQINKSMLIEEIADGVRDKKILGISDIRDESDRDGMRIVIELKRDSASDVVLNQLMKHSKMQVTFGINVVALINNEPKTLNLIQIIQCFIDHRKDVVRKRTEFDLQKAEDKKHILEGLIIALDDIDNAIELIKTAKSVDAASEGLMERYKLTKVQAQAILDMKLQKLTSMEQDKIRKECDELAKLVEELKNILADEKKILEIIKNELIYLKEQFGDKRKTEIVFGEYEDIEIEDLIEPENQVITITHLGYSKRQPLDAYRQQNRGGKGIIGTETTDDDFVEHMFIANTHSHMLIFTDAGQVYWLKVYQIPEGARYAKGKAIVNLIELNKDEKITAVVPVKEFNDTHYLVLATKKGIIKKSSLKHFSNPRKGGIRAITLDEGDNLINAKLTDGTNHIILGTKKGLAIRFDEKDARPIGRTSMGVIGIRLKKEDEVVEMVIADDNLTLLTVTEYGYGKRTPMQEYRPINRGGMGVINIQCTERNGNVVTVKSVSDDDEIMLTSKEGIMIRIPAKTISTIGRNTQGVRIMKLDEKDRIVAAAKIIPENDNVLEIK